MWLENWPAAGSCITAPTMDRNANKIPQVRLADGFEQRALEGHEDPIILLTLGGEQSLLSAKDAEALRIALLGIQFNFMDYSLCLRRRADTLKRYTASAMATDDLEVFESGEFQGAT